MACSRLDVVLVSIGLAGMTVSDAVRAGGEALGCAVGHTLVRLEGSLTTVNNTCLRGSQSARRRLSPQSSETA